MGFFAIFRHFGPSKKQTYLNTWPECFKLQLWLVELVNLLKDGVKWSFHWEEIQDFRFFLDFLSIFSQISIENWKG